MVALVTAAGLLVACGGDDDESEPEPAAEPASEPAGEPAAEPEPAGEPAGEPAAEPADDADVFDSGGVYFLRDGTGQVTVSLSDGTAYTFDTTCGVYIDQFEETYEHSVDDDTFQWYSRKADDGGAGSMGILGQEVNFVANAIEQFEIESDGNRFEARVEGLIPGQGTDSVTAQVQSVCNE